MATLRIYFTAVEEIPVDDDFKLTQDSIEKEFNKLCYEGEVSCINEGMLIYDNGDYKDVEF